MAALPARNPRNTRSGDMPEKVTTSAAMPASTTRANNTTTQKASNDAGLMTTGLAYAMHGTATKAKITVADRGRTQPRRDRRVGSSALGLFVELFERFSIFSFPGDKSVCASAMYYDRRCGWAGELRVLGEDEKAVLLGQCAIGNELFTLGYDVGIALGGWAFLDNGGRALKQDEAVWGRLTC